MARFTALVCALGMLVGTGSAMAATPFVNSSARITTTEAPARLAPSKAAPAKSETSDYAARERSSKDLAEFKGGHAGYIAVPVGTIILVTILLLILI